MKKVHPNTLGWKAGVQAQDRIVQVRREMEGGRVSQLWYGFNEPMKLSEWQLVAL